MRHNNMNSALSLVYGKGSDQPLETPHGEPLNHYRARVASLRKRQPIQPDVYSSYLQSNWRQAIRTLIAGKVVFTDKQITQLAHDMGTMLEVDGWSVKPVQIGSMTTWKGLLVSTYIANNHVGVLFKSTGGGLYSVQSMVYDLPEMDHHAQAAVIH